MRYLHFCAHEQFPPDQLLRQAVAAERAGFDGIGCSDHLQPWWEDGESGNAWVWLGAAAQATEHAAFGTGVTPPGPRYHPAVIAQAWATLEVMYPGRPFLGFGSGEALNEAPLGHGWPSPRAQVERMEEALEMIHALWEGKKLSGEGEHFASDGAFIHSLPEGRRPPIYVSAFGPKAAAVAGRQGDGLWTLADPEKAPKLIDAYRGAAEDAGREPGEIVLQAGFSWAEDDDAALEGARVWKGAQPEEFYKDDWHDPKAMHEHGKEQVSDEELREALIISADPAEHVERVRQIEALGATMVVLMNNAGADPLGAIEMYGREVLPRLGGLRTPTRTWRRGSSFPQATGPSYLQIGLFRRPWGLRWGRPDQSARTKFVRERATVSWMASASVDFTVSFDAPDQEGWIVARVLEVPGAMSQGRTREEARENVLDALQTVLTPDEELAGETPEADREHLRFTAAA